ncbi:HAD-IA family hydrolase (plasmid) [Agrobacterium tumefaciens]|uniref:HAD family hydrolase n=1 Tax=Agrobacterium tumefaciens TaxID=358 RepID=UPI000E0C8D66|nr:HAD-IA family hydrolase [Agrobacterium tumefaciens]WQE43517.1 HAD-IA family hydrolase [Agrobacterium tumefaciens]
MRCVFFWKISRHGRFRSGGDAVIGVDLVQKGKPAPDVYIAAAERLGLQPSACIALDDSDLGVRAALAAGMQTVIQVPDMVISRDMKAHHLVNSLNDAREILGL